MGIWKHAVRVADQLDGSGRHGEAARLHFIVDTATSGVEMLMQLRSALTDLRGRVDPDSDEGRALGALESDVLRHLQG